jgi:glycosyltransferase 2 family protein
MSNNNTSFKRTLLIIIGTALGLLFLYLAFRDVSWQDFVSGLKTLQPLYLIPAVLLLLLIQVIRAVRFGVIVRPFCNISFRSLFDMLNIWAGASMIMPARLGELVRPYLLQQCGSSFTSGIGAIMVERFFDLSGLLVLLGIVLWRTPEIPAIYSRIGMILLLCLVLGYAIVLCMLSKRALSEKVVCNIVRILPSRLGNFITGLFKKLIDGLEAMGNPKRAFIILLYSIALWLTFSALTYIFLLAFQIKAPFLVAVTIQVFICFGVALPSAPGFIGTFHAAGRYALALFGIQAVTAVSFATVYHLFSLVMCILLGLFSYFTSRFRFDYSLFEKPQTDSHNIPLQRDMTSL